MLEALCWKSYCSFLRCLSAGDMLLKSTKKKNINGMNQYELLSNRPAFEFNLPLSPWIMTKSN